MKGPGEVVERLLAVQAQDPKGARLAVRARLSETVKAPRASRVDEQLDAGSLVVGWLNRGTLHLVQTDDYQWLHALTSPGQASSNQTRLRQEGVSEAQAEKGVKLIAKTLTDGPATRPELRERLQVAGIPVEGQALVHILYLASIRGLIVRGPMAGREQAFVLVRDWIGEPEQIDPEQALAELARRYLKGHGPASDRDLAAWSGLPLGQVRSGLEAISSELVERQGLLDLKGVRRRRQDSIRLLGSFDPVLHGWQSREWIIPEADRRGVVTVNGLFRPSILVGEQILGTWAMPAGKVELKPFGKLQPAVGSRLEEEAAKVLEYLGS
jgi:hypothetical protein